MTERPLIVALPSKGRIEEDTRTFFARAGLAIQKGGTRDYIGKLAGIPDAEIMFMSAGEIPAALENGTAHLGVTGEDLIRDRAATAEKSIALITPLGYARADVVVAVPSAWIDVSTMSDLDEVAHDFRARHRRHIRVATKFLQLTRSFFASHGLVDYRIVESAGATEGAPASGFAEIIVDITSTGATLAANGLKVLSDGVILRSQAQLAASRSAAWTARADKAATRILDLIWATQQARLTSLRFAVPADLAALENSMKAVSRESFFTTGGAGEITLYFEEDAAHAVIALLRKHGVEGPLATMRPGQLFTAENPLAKALFAR
jgi:ATP phosphoribosyltransferase